ncbi:hypothetical protein MY4824_003417 [Beauveria thailandica]
MAPSVASRSEKEAASPLSPDWHQSVLDWASPDEERDNPGKLDVFGKPLASFHELRTREFNKKPGKWTAKHAAHVARWEFHQAGYISTQPRESNQASMRNVLLEEVIECLKFISSTVASERTTFAKVSQQIISLLGKKASLAVESIPHDELKAGNPSRERWETMSNILPPKPVFLVAKFLSPTGALPESLLQPLKMLRRNRYLRVEKQDVDFIRPRPTRKVGDDAEHQAGKDATRAVDASPSKTMSFDHSSLQLLINKTIDDRLQEFNAAKVGKKRKFGDVQLDEPIEAAVEKKLASYEGLLDDYTRLTDHLVHSFNSFRDLPEKAAQLKQRREELKAAVTQTTIPLKHEAKADDDGGRI